MPGLPFPRLAASPRHDCPVPLTHPIATLKKDRSERLRCGSLWSYSSITTYAALPALTPEAPSSVSVIIPETLTATRFPLGATASGGWQRR
jgi:hypothetical protein